MYSFVNNTFCKSDSFHFNLEDRAILLSTFDTISILNDTATFSNVDFMLFRSQFKNMVNFMWQKNRLNGSNVISTETIREILRKRKGWKKFRQKYGYCYISLSMPIFNHDFTYCIIAIHNHCGYCTGHGGTYVYHLENGEWVEVKQYSAWSS
ncbi:MAG: hypothetical protein DRI84_06115 [Bacteroidetes bacterium]|nr:MAG: hypothetical protein DRI84_06115 [Bacteroidota bacterium]